MRCPKVSGRLLAFDFGSSMSPGADDVVRVQTTATARAGTISHSSPFAPPAAHQIIELRLSERLSRKTEPWTAEELGTLRPRSKVGFPTFERTYFMLRSGHLK